VHQTEDNPLATALPIISDLKRRNVQKANAPDKTRDDSDLWRLFTQLASFKYPVNDFRQCASQVIQRLYLPDLVERNKASNLGWSSYFWILAVCDLNGSNAALDNSLYTFCMVQVYLTKTGHVTIDECLKCYNHTLQHLWKILEDPGARYNDETLAAIAVLSTCEVSHLVT
jgi:hypothetical protein